MHPDDPAPVALAAARRLAARYDDGTGDVRLVRTLSSTWIAIGAHTVVKVHDAGTDPEDLAGRLALAADPSLHACVLAPLVAEPVLLADPTSPRWGTVWPRVDPLPQDVAAAPWAQAGALLARLHRSVPSRPVTARPVQGSVRRLRDALSRLAAAAGRGGALPPQIQAAADVVRASAERLPDSSWCSEGAPGRPCSLVHGDWHLGQLGRLPDAGRDSWRLIDVDDLGIGDPVWDLGRPAAFWAAGLMPDHDWASFLGAYRDGGGPAVPPQPADPWPAVDAAAQACVVLAAAGAVRRAILGGGRLGEIDARMVEVCARLPGAQA